MRHYETIHTEDTRGFHVIFSVTPEDFHPREVFMSSLALHQKIFILETASMKL